MLNKTPALCYVSTHLVSQLYVFFVTRENERYMFVRNTQMFVTATGNVRVDMEAGRQVWVNRWLHTIPPVTHHYSFHFRSPIIYTIRCVEPCVVCWKHYHCFKKKFSFIYSAQWRLCIVHHDLQNYSHDKR